MMVMQDYLWTSVLAQVRWENLGKLLSRIGGSTMRLVRNRGIDEQAEPGHRQQQDETAPSMDMRRSEVPDIA